MFSDGGLCIQNNDGQDTINALHKIESGKNKSYDFKRGRSQIGLHHILILAGGAGFSLWLAGQLVARWIQNQEYSSYEQLERMLNLWELLEAPAFWGQIVFFISIIGIVGIILRKLDMFKQ